MAVEDPNGLELVVRCALSMSRIPREPKGPHNTGFDVLRARTDPTWYPLPLSLALIETRRDQGVHIRGGPFECLARLENVCDDVFIAQCDSEQFSDQAVYSFLSLPVPPLPVAILPCEPFLPSPLAPVVSRNKGLPTLGACLDGSSVVSPTDPRALKFFSNSARSMLRCLNKPGGQPDDYLDTL